MRMLTFRMKIVQVPDTHMSFESHWVDQGLTVTLGRPDVHPLVYRWRRGRSEQQMISQIDLKAEPWTR